MGKFVDYYNEELEFPDDMSDEAIAAILKKRAAPKKTTFMEAANETYGDIEESIGKGVKSAIEKYKPVLDLVAKPAEYVKKGYEQSPLGRVVEGGRELLKKVPAYTAGIRPSEIISPLYNETGRGIQLQKRGLLDPNISVSGVTDLAKNIALDPLTYVPIPSAALVKQGLLKTMRGVAKITGSASKKIETSLIDDVAKQAKEEVMMKRPEVSEATPKVPSAYVDEGMMVVDNKIPEPKVKDIELTPSEKVEQLGIMKDKFAKLRLTSPDKVPSIDETTRLAKGEGFFEKMMVTRDFQFNQLERQTGVKTGDLVPKFAEAQQQGRYMAQDYTKRLIDTSNQFKTVPQERIKELLRGAEAITPDEIAAKTEYRKILDDLYKQGKEAGMDMGYLDNYYPDRYVAGRPGEVPLSTPYGKTQKDIKMTSEYSKRQNVPDPKLVKNPDEAIGSVIREVANAKLYKQVLPDAMNKADYLRALGLDNQASNIERWWESSMGWAEGTSRKLNAEMFSKDGVLDTQAFLKANEVFKDPGRMEKFLRMLNNQLYATKLFTGNLKAVFYDQPTQNLSVGIPEYGAKYVGNGIKNYAQGKYRSLLKEVERDIIAPDLDVQEMYLLGERPKESMLSKIINAPAKPMQKIFGDMDSANRKAAFLTGYTKFKDLGMIPETMDFLWDGQQRMVKEAYSKGGIEAAAREYGKIASHRMNLLYTMANKPYYLQTGLGKYIPFTTWTRNMFTKLLYDADKVDLNTLAKRMAIPIALNTAVSTLTGVSARNYHPFAPMSFSGLAGGNIGGGLQGMTELAQQGKFDKLASDAIRLMPLGEAVYKLNKAVNADDPLNAFGLATNPNSAPFFIKSILDKKSSMDKGKGFKE